MELFDSLRVDFAFMGEILMQFCGKEKVRL